MPPLRLLSNSLWDRCHKYQMKVGINLNCHNLQGAGFRHRRNNSRNISDLVSRCTAAWSCEAPDQRASFQLGAERNFREKLPLNWVAARGEGKLHTDRAVRAQLSCCWRPSHLLRSSLLVPACDAPNPAAQSRRDPCCLSPQLNWDRTRPLRLKARL